MALYKGTQTHQYNRVYLRIKDGKIMQDSELGGNETFSSVDGKLERIYSRLYGERSKVKRWYIELQDRHVVYTISFPYHSAIFTSIVLSLASADLSRQSSIRLEPHLYESTTRVRTLCNEKELDLLCYHIPAVKESARGKVQTEDDSERMKFIESIVADINKRILK